MNMSVMNMKDAREIRSLKRMVKKSEEIDLLMREALGAYENSDKKKAA